MPVIVSVAARYWSVRIQIGGPDLDPILLDAAGTPTRLDLDQISFPADRYRGVSQPMVSAKYGFPIRPDYYYESYEEWKHSSGRVCS